MILFYICIVKSPSEEKKNELAVVDQLPSVSDPVDCSTPGLPGPYHLPEFTQVHTHCIVDTVESSHSLTPPSPSARNLSRH